MKCYVFNSKNSLLLFLFVITLINTYSSIYSKNILAFNSDSTLNLRDDPLDEVSERDIKSVLKENRKLERNLKKMNFTILDLQTKLSTTVNENEEMKIETMNKTKNIEDLLNKVKVLKENGESSGAGNAIKEVKNILSGMSQLNSLAHQVEMNNLEEKELKEEFSVKLKDITSSQTRIQNIYDDIKINYQEKVDLLLKQLLKIQKTDEAIKKKLFIIEKEKEKTSISRKMIKLGARRQMSSIIEPVCVNRGSCKTCLSDPQCVWCSETKQCAQGDIFGAYDGRCNTKFKYSKCEMTNLCDELKTCTDCIENASCGWCAESKMCLEGNIKNPVGITCSNGYFHKFNQGRCSTHRLLNNFTN